MVERHLAKVNVASSNLVFRSNFIFYTELFVFFTEKALFFIGFCIKMQERMDPLVLA